MVDRQIAMTRPRLDRTREWGGWFLSVDGATLVFNNRASGNYQVDLAELVTYEDARIRVEDVVALKSSWATQRVVDDLRRALKALTPHHLPFVEVPR